MKKIFLTSLVLSSILFAQTAQELINKNGCLSCHAIASKKNAPAFAGIAMKNKRFEGANAKAIIMNSIENGSKGKYPRFSNTAMPSYKNLSQQELSIIADYILAQSSKAPHSGRGQGMGMGRGMR